MTDTADTDTDIVVDPGTDGDDTDDASPARESSPTATDGYAPVAPEEYDVPDDADPVECAYCSRPFAAERFLALHRGLAHEDAIDAAEREAFENAHGAETGEIRRFRLKALGALVLLYFGLLMVYALVI